MRLFVSSMFGGNEIAGRPRQMRLFVSSIFGGNGIAGRPRQMRLFVSSIFGGNGIAGRQLKGAGIESVIFSQPAGIRPPLPTPLVVKTY